MLKKLFHPCLSFLSPLIILIALPCFAHAADNTVWSDSYALEANGKYDKAAAVLAPLLNKGRDSELALMRYGWLNYLQGNYNDSIRNYKQALERNSRSFDARLGITLPLMAQQRWNEASRYLQQILIQSPYHYWAHIKLMACEEGLRKWETLAKHSTSLAAYYPSDATILVYLARAYAWQGKPHLAKQAYQRVLARIPGHIEAQLFINK